MNKLSVRLYGKPVGVLEKTSLGKLHFSYLHEAKMIISHCMPLKEKVFDHKICKAYFGGLLSEVEYSLYSRDLFSYFMEYGKDLPGAISFHLLSDPIILDEENQSNVAKEYTIEKTEEPLLFENYFYLKMANALGITVPDFHLTYQNKTPILIIHMRRLHSEDFCQALGICTDKKYEYDNGPGYAALFDKLKVTKVPAKERDKLIKIVLFNTYINNTQISAKDYTLQEIHAKQWELGPVHMFYSNPNKTAVFPMKIGKAEYLEALQESDWKLFCKDIHYSYPIFKALKQDFLEKMNAAAKKAQDACHKEKIPCKNIVHVR